MARPIVWALGTVGMAALSAAGGAERLADRLGLGTSAASTTVGGTAGESGVVTVAADLQGHFVVHPTMDGHRLRMMVDTGANVVALTYEDAQMGGVRVAAKDFTQRIATANGSVEVAPVRIGEIRVGAVSVRNVEAVVVPQGRLGTSLLGMSFLKRIGGFEIARGQLTLRS